MPWVISDPGRQASKIISAVMITVKPGRKHQEHRTLKNTRSTVALAAASIDIGNVSIEVWKPERSRLDFIEFFAAMRTHFGVPRWTDQPQQRRCEMLHCSSKVYREY